MEKIVGRWVVLFLFLFLFIGAGYTGFYFGYTRPMQKAASEFMLRLYALECEIEATEASCGYAVYPDDSWTTADDPVSARLKQLEWRIEQLPIGRSEERPLEEPS